MGPGPGGETGQTNRRQALAGRDRRGGGRRGPKGAEGGRRGRPVSVPLPLQTEPTSASAAVPSRPAPARPDPAASSQNSPTCWSSLLVAVAAGRDDLDGRVPGTNAAIPLKLDDMHTPNEIPILQWITNTT